MFPNPTGYMLTSFGFPLLEFEVYSQKISKMINHFSEVLNFKRLFLKLVHLIRN